MRSSVFWFVAVGGTAALTHLGVFMLAQAHMWPELANALGFVLAFGVSFVGHRFLSFKDTRAGLRTSLIRFVVTALAGFAANELVFVLLLRGLGWPTLLALLCGLTVAAVQTYALGRYWAFHA